MYSAGLLKPEGRRFFELVTGEASRALRIEKGFEP
jgi:hypothetical protein